MRVLLLVRPNSLVTIATLKPGWLRLLPRESESMGLGGVPLELRLALSRTVVRGLALAVSLSLLPCTVEDLCASVRRFGSPPETGEHTHARGPRRPWRCSERFTRAHAQTIFPLLQLLFHRPDARASITDYFENTPVRVSLHPSRCLLPALFTHPRPVGDRGRPHLHSGEENEVELIIGMRGIPGIVDYNDTREVFFFEGLPDGWSFFFFFYCRRLDRFGLTAWCEFSFDFRSIGFCDWLVGFVGDIYFWWIYLVNLFDEVADFP